MRLEITLVRPGRLNSFLNSRLLSILGINTVCYAPPALYPVPPGCAVPMIRKGRRPGAYINNNEPKTRLLYSIAGSAMTVCRFSEARTLAALCALSKHFFRAKTTCFSATQQTSDEADPALLREVGAGSAHFPPISYRSG
ncbi:hypothetical protein [Herbaspirillum lusitanum]|uniref:hypothetical protein n=1 Tax=Herbaspirillum lusitanum TaxID=213312 RepID=UPI0012F4AD90|nr:hypothetical protein [Herbaspirillum lusitanum]